MKRLFLLCGAIVIGLAPFAPQAGRAQDLRGQIESIVQDYLTKHPDEVGQLAKDYFVRHPEAFTQIFTELLKHRGARTASTVSASPASGSPPIDRKTVIASNAKLLFTSQRQVNLGNPQGNVTLVEFFDYNCGFCKRTLPDMLALLKDDPKLKVVLKEFPILGPGSVEAARVAVAVRMQDPSGQKYLAFHRELLGSPGPTSKEKALAAAKNQGLDMERLKKDMTGPEAAATLAEDMKLAQDLGIHGTPSFVIGNSVVVGAVGLSALQADVAMARGNATN